MKKDILIPLFLVAFFSSACSSSKPNKSLEMLSAKQKVETEYFKDKRYSVFDISYPSSKDGKTVVAGSTTSKTAKDALISRLGNRNQIIDSVRLLPDSAKLGGKIYGVVDLSVCNIRATNSFSAEMSLQGLLGMPVRLLDDDGFYRIQTPDNYIGWVLHSGITPMNKAQYDEWNRSEKIVITSHYGFTYSLPDIHSQVVSDVVSGDRLKWNGVEGNYYKVLYPDGKSAFISKDICMIEREWRTSLKQDAASIIKTAYTLMGIPYVWGCNSSKGADCSGFVRTVLFIHDIIIPRDASQMANIGQRIDIAPECSNLQPGDLIFFGKKATAGSKEHVSHVALYVGNQHFIHSMGNVHESSFNPKDANYDAYDLNRRLHAVRFLPYLNKESDINTTITNPFYK